MSERIDNNNILQVLDWVYEKSLNGLSGAPSAEELGNEYLNKSGGNVEQACNNLINWQLAKCTTSGFLTGLGGLITLLVAIPANISSVLYVQIRMIAAIAYIGGYDIKSDEVKSIVYMCLTGNAAMEIAKGVGIKIGTKLTNTAIKKISFETIKKINQAVGFRLITKFGSKGVLNLGKAIPFVGGVIGGGMDLTTTKAIGSVSKQVFIIG